MPRVRIVGLGRAGRSFERALGKVGWVVDGVGRDADLESAGVDVDLVLICTPDAAIGQVAASIGETEAVVAHVAGSLGLDVLAPHRHVAAIHPLMTLPDAEAGANRLPGGWFAIAGHPMANQVVGDLGGQSFTVADGDRAVYHAAACIASNHLVALMGQVERLADGIDVPAGAYGAIAMASLENALAMGAARALTGPAARGDDETIERHLAALAPDERAAYAAMVAEARRLAAERRD